MSHHSLAAAAVRLVTTALIRDNRPLGRELFKLTRNRGGCVISIWRSCAFFAKSANLPDSGRLAASHTHMACNRGFGTAAVNYEVMALGLARYGLDNSGVEGRVIVR